MQTKRIVIAIDGVSGSGKSTLAKGIAKHLGFMYLDTGAMYRAATWKVLGSKTDINDAAKVTDVVRGSELKVEKSSDGMKVFVDGIDVSDEIRKPLISNNVSNVSKIKGVREIMVRLQREIAADNDIVLEGRDTGTVVFPNADVKFYLDASIEERAKRRLIELKEKGIAISFDEVKKNIEERDRIDSGRDTSPLIKAKDAVVIDSTGISIEEKTAKALDTIRRKIAK